MIRTQRSGGYTVLPNGILRDTNLSLKTKGLFAIILSPPVYGRRLHHPGCGGTISRKPDNDENAPLSGN